MDQKSYCMKCKQEVTEETQEHECGGRQFVFGKVIPGEKGFVCECGNDQFKSGVHLDYSHKAVNNYRCVKCGNVIGTEYYRDAESMMYWG